VFADMDGDRDLDLFIGGIFGDPSFIYANNGNGTFTDVTAGSGIDGMGAEHSVSAAFGDYDLDGDLDMFIAHWGTDRDPDLPGDTENLWRNDSSSGVIRFTSVSVPAGISPSVIGKADPLRHNPDDDFTLTPTFARIDSDLYPDILSVAEYNRTQLHFAEPQRAVTPGQSAAIFRGDRLLGGGRIARALVAQPRPVEPNPPSPRSLSDSSLTSSMRGVS
jgi:hypothetical protein